MSKLLISLYRSLLIGRWQKKVVKSLKGWKGKNIPLSNGLDAPYKTLCLYLLTLFICNLNFSLLFYLEGHWGVWSQWSTCSVTCGPGGIQSRTRQCNNPALFINGISCAQPELQNKPCGSNHCNKYTSKNYCNWEVIIFICQIVTPI